MNLTGIELCPGGTLYVIPKDTFKTDFLMLGFTVPLARETVSRYAMLPAVLCRGSARYPTLESLAMRLDSLYNAGIGGRSHKCGEAQQVSFQLRCLEQEVVPPEDDGEPLFDALLDTFCEVLFSPLTEDGAFLAPYVEGEKKNLCESIRAKINHKTSYAMSRLEEEMCAGEVWGIPGRGSEEDVAAVTPQNLYEAYTDMLAYAPVSLYYVGKKSAGEVVQSLAPFVHRLSAYRREPLYAPVTQVIRRAEHPVREVCEDMDAKQSKLCIGYRTDAVLSDGDFYRFALFNELLGGCASSKLFLEVRERRGLCYFCTSYPEAQKGLLYIACGINADDREEAEGAIYAQIDAICSGDISDEEFRAAKKSLISGYREIEDSAASLAVWYANRHAAGIGTSPEETAQQVAACTKQQLSECAARITRDTVYFLHGTAVGGGDEEDAYDE